MGLPSVSAWRLQLVSRPVSLILILLCIVVVLKEKDGAAECFCLEAPACIQTSISHSHSVVYCSCPEGERWCCGVFLPGSSGLYPDQYLSFSFCCVL